jgi:2-polyprenyl-6-hydroxyphenyl methylase/3-demethylubiquinone-9 3-methyltransferase
MGLYYSDSLSARNLERCYQIAPPRIQQYLDAEIDYVVTSLKSSDILVELGCGYGRVLSNLGSIANTVVGLDLAVESLRYGRSRTISNELAQMTAGQTAFRDDTFDVVVCIQNGISAFKVDPRDLVRESLRIIRPTGRCFFSTYSDRIWEDRLDWFRLQAEENLLGKIDWDRTERGTIVCKDGFTATTFTEAEFLEIASDIGAECKTIEVDSSSLFGIFSHS